MEAEWLRETLRFSLKASVSTILFEGGPPQQRDPRFRKLAEGIIYSRKLILTYHLVVVGFIVLLSVIHWSRCTVRSRHRKALKRRLLGAQGAFDGSPETLDSGKQGEGRRDIEGASSSSSSTLDGTASPPRKVDEDEQTPLLNDGHSIRPPRTIISYILAHTKAFLMYQPPPIRFFNKILPSNGSSIFILVFVALNIFYTVFHINWNIFELFVLVDRCGLVFVANLPLLYILAAKNQPLKVITGQSYESLNILHRRLGELLCLEAFLHSFGMIVVWYTLLSLSGFTLLEFLTNRTILLGIGAFISYELIYFTSLASFRQRWYELFLGLHVVLQLVALVFVFLHHYMSRIYVGIALAIFVVDRLMYRVGVKSTSIEAEASILADGETVKLSANIVKRPGYVFSGLVGRSVTGGWRSTDHVFVSVPSLARKHIIQAHPFTIASAAPTHSDDEARLDLLIRAQDGFSFDLLKQVRRTNRLTVRLDGPYGSSHARNMLEDSDLAILVAGGSGIAVAWPLVHHLLNVAHSTDTEIAPTSLLRRQKIILIWVIHEHSHLSWIETEEIRKIEKWGVDIIIPSPTRIYGRPDLKNMIEDMVSDYGDLERKRIGVVASGPDSMGRLVRNTCADLVRNGRDVNVMIEKFGW
ncbi:hypothetical protein B7494_g1809 [Chlorociboria aeruginascens]|nr:hypothetical protein B7494_g1809 [Chlorociboria aeruginascens]